MSRASLSLSHSLSSSSSQLKLLQLAKVFGVDWRIYLKLTILHIRVNEAAQEIIVRSVTAGVKGSEERILSLGTEPLRFEIHRREVCSMLQHSKRPCDAQRAEGAWPKRIWSSVANWDKRADRSTHDESTFHIAERIPEGTKREHGVSVEEVAIPAEELTTDSVPLPVGPIAMWHAAMIRSYDMMMIEFTSGKSSWNIIQRTKRSSVARTFVREKPQNVRFMIIVTDPSNVSTREVIQVTREVIKTKPMICSPKAPLEMVLMKPLLPRPKKKPLIGQTHADRANVGQIYKPNAKIVALRDDRSDIAKGTESQINDFAKVGRDKAAEAKTDVVAESKTDEVPQKCCSKTDVERWTEAPQQMQQSQQPSSSTDDAGTSVLIELLNKLSTCPSKLELVINELLNKLSTCLTMPRSKLSNKLWSKLSASELRRQKQQRPLRWTR